MSSGEYMGMNGWMDEWMEGWMDGGTTKTFIYDDNNVVDLSMLLTIIIVIIIIIIYSPANSFLYRSLAGCCVL